MTKILGLLAILPVCLGGQAGDQPPPNLIHIVVDDYGWSYRPGPDNTNDESKTPNMDELVADGLFLDRFYVHKICSPSRSALLSGRSPIHVNVENVGPDVFNPDNTMSGYQGVSLNMTLMSEPLKQAGYKTRFVGKWDIGMATSLHHPKNRGFDSWFGYWHHANDYWQQTEGTCPTSSLKSEDSSAAVHDTVDVYDLWRYEPDMGMDGPAVANQNDLSCNQFNQDGNSEESGGQCVYEEDLLNQEVTSILSTHNTTLEGPLFLMYAMHLVHWPLQIPEAKEEQFKDVQDERRRKMVSMVSYVDDAIGNVVDTIKNNEMLKGSVLWNNTLLVIHSDNGGEIIFEGTCGGNNYPLRGGKFSNWEGGIRSFGIINGGYLPNARRGLVESSLFSIEDWYSTYCHLANVDPFDAAAAANGLPALDSINQWSIIESASSTTSNPPPRTEVIIGDTSALSYNGQGDTLVGGIIKYDNTSGKLYKLLIGAANKNFLVDQDVIPGSMFPDVFDHSNNPDNVPSLLRPQAHTRYCGRVINSDSPTSLLLESSSITTVEAKAAAKNGTCLFDITSSPDEAASDDLSSQNPDLFNELLSRIDELQTTVFSPWRGEVDPGACDQALNGNGGYWGPWIEN